MNFLKKGPEFKLPKKMPALKTPSVKVPGFLSEIYYELRERHLLPLVVVLVVAVVAVPIALSESTEPISATPLPEAGANASAKTTQVVVAKSAPGLRDYNKRLSDLTSEDPFKAKAGAEPSSAAPATTPEGGEEPIGGEPIESGSGGSGTGETAPSAPVETSPNDDRIVHYSFAIDVRVVPISVKGKPSKAEPEVRKDLPELTMLPSRETPALVFMGVTKDGKKALMLISSNVKGIFGDNVCAVGGEACELLSLEQNVPETVVYGGNEKVYRIELLDLDLVRSDKLNKAPLGKPHKKSGKPSGS